MFLRNFVFFLVTILQRLIPAVFKYKRNQKEREEYICQKENMLQRTKAFKGLQHTYDKNKTRASKLISVNS